jgi:hypothetical protein
MDFFSTVSASKWSIGYSKVFRRQSLISPGITIEQGTGGKYNFEKPLSAGTTSPAVDLPKISLSGATLHYADKQFGEGFGAADYNLELRHLLLAG